MPVDRIIDFGRGFSSTVEPPILEKILEQYKILPEIKGSYRIPKGMKIRGHDSDYPDLILKNRQMVEGSFLLEPEFDSEKLISLYGRGEFFADAEQDDEDDDADAEQDDEDDDYLQLNLTFADIKFTPRRTQDGLIYRFDREIDCRDKHGFIKYIDGKFSAKPQYCKKTGRIERLKFTKDASDHHFFSLTKDKNGDPVNLLLLNNAKVIYKSTAEILDGLVK